MRKLFLLVATATLIMSSCTSEDEVIQAGTENGDAIEFRTLMDKGTNSRAAVTNAENMLSFTVTGIWSKGTVADNNKYLFNAFGITRGEDGLWTYTPKRYLPNDGGQADFYAYSPAASKNVSKGIKDYDAGNAITYTVPTIGKTDAQEDFLIARRTNIKNGSGGSVKLNFHHALSRIKFHGRKTKDDITYVISKIALVNLLQTGTLNLSSAYITEDGAIDHTNTTATKWVPSGDKVDYVVDMGKSPIFLKYSAETTNDYYSLLGETNDILVLPQTPALLTKPDPATNEEFAIAVSYKAYKGSTYYVGRPEKPGDDGFDTVYLPVKGDATGGGIEFKMERQYNFYLTFGHEVGGQILLNATVSDWADATDVNKP